MRPEYRLYGYMDPSGILGLHKDERLVVRVEAARVLAVCKADDDDVSYY